MVEQNALTELLRKARRRQIRNLVIEQGSFSAALALGGAIVLLVLGTEILNWYWLVLLFAASLGAGLYRGRNKVLSGYRVAQSMDARLGFQDTLSTAHYFATHSDRIVSSPEFVKDQRQVAEDLARSADVRSGLPFIRPRTFYVNAALAVAVFAMFGLRYGINRSLDLRSSLIRINFDGFLGAREIAKADNRAKRPFDRPGQHDEGVAVDPWESKPSDLAQAPDSALDNPEDSESNPDSGADPAAKTKDSGDEKSPEGDDLLNNSPNKDQSAKADDKQNGSDSGSPEGGSQAGKQDDNAKKSSDSSSGENSSLAEKMRDAIANLLAKIKSQPKSGEGKQGGSSAQNNQQSAQKNQNQPNSKGSTGDQQSQSNANSQSQGDQQSENGSQQTAQGNSDAKNSQQNSDGKSGIGKQDGDKAIREAEQLAAMGKISEILGKRSENVKGEVMVEVSSGKQQLRTQYTDRNAQHAEAGGEINRDEIPLAYQQYVQQYFEEIRKQPAAKPKADSKPKAAAN